MTENERRADEARRTLAFFAQLTGLDVHHEDERQCAVVDLLANLMHLARLDDRWPDPEDVIREANSHFAHELAHDADNV